MALFLYVQSVFHLSLSIVTFMLTIHNFFSPSTHLTLTPASPTSRLLCKLYPFGCLPTFWLLTVQKLDFSSLDSNNNWLKLISAHLMQYTLLIVLASFLMNILLFLTRYLLFLNSATHIFINFAASIHILIPKQPALLLYLHCSLLAWPLQLCYLYYASLHLPEYQPPTLDNIRVMVIVWRSRGNQNCSVLGCVTQCSQSAAHSYEQFLQVQQIGFITLGPLRHA